MNFEERKLVINKFINSKFIYCPLTWLLHSRNKNNKTKHLHKRCPHLLYHDKQLSYKKLLEKDVSVSKYHKKMLAYANKMFKIKYNLSPENRS